MKKFSDSSSVNSQKLKKKTLRNNVKKITIGTVLVAVGISSYAVIAHDDSMVSSKGKAVSIAEAGNVLYADGTSDYETTTQLAEETLSDVNKTGSVALSSKKASNKKLNIVSGGGLQVATEETASEVEATEVATVEATTTEEALAEDEAASGLPEDQVAVDPSTEKSTEGLPEENVMYVDGESSGTYLGTFWITAYCPCSICCGAYSNPSNPTTASGAPAVEGVTCAAPSNFAFGTELIVDGHTYTVQDRGGAVNGNHLDIYFSNHQAALNFATGYYDVYTK